MTARSSHLKLSNFDANDFVKNYWQKKPLFIRQALGPELFDLTPKDLQKLAMHEDIESRIVESNPKANRWLLHHGPFTANQLRSLGKKDWTLLVQDVDKFLPEVASLLDAFQFIPNWRIDDIMISHAVKGGSVGAHIDNYDVFLVQGRGVRTWHIANRPIAQGKEELLENCDLRVLKKFKADKTWDLHPGDILYLPPRVAHHGVAKTDDCMTYSVGFRAPRRKELRMEFMEHLLSEDDEVYLSEKSIKQSTPHGKLPDDVLKLLDQALTMTLPDRMTRYRWLARHLSAQKPHIYVHPPEQLVRVNTADFKKTGLILERDIKTRAFYFSDKEHVYFFANGREFTLGKMSEPCVEIISCQRKIELLSLSEFAKSKEVLRFVNELLELGFYRLVKGR